MKVAVAEERGFSAALDALATLITKRKRADRSNKGESFHLLYDYLKILDLEKPLSDLSIIHVAGTKGKGSTCAFAESILRTCRHRTGLFTSPHLVDVRERFRLDGELVSEDLFSQHFWWCWDRLKAGCDNELPMPPYFRFLTLLAFRIFTAEKVDVAILEVGLGGRYDATNVVVPDVCGVASLGFDHMEILGHTLPEIAGEKAGIFKAGVPAITSPQREDAMAVLKKRASDLSIVLVEAPPLETYEADDLQLGLAGDHQRINASLAVALCRSWAKKRGSEDHIAMVESAFEKGDLPEVYKVGLSITRFPGRAQVVREPVEVPDNCSDAVLRQRCDSVTSRSLAFFLDGAHTPESMEICAKWFCRALKEDLQIVTGLASGNGNGNGNGYLNGASNRSSFRRVLLFNCMPERDPQLLLPPLIDVCQEQGLHFHTALFLPGTSSYTSVQSRQSPAFAKDAHQPPDLTWQRKLQRTWCDLLRDKNSGNETNGFSPKVYDTDNSPQFPVAESLLGMEPDDARSKKSTYGTCAVMHSLPATLDWLRQCARRNPSVHLQVVVTGSLHLVGDVLKLLKR